MPAMAMSHVSASKPIENPKTIEQIERAMSGSISLSEMVIFQSFQDDEMCSILIIHYYCLFVKGGGYR